ncbi:hypothetical protein [Amycolatopsis regifaucium]|uniref:DUF4352 domain-containing protein n=1 Tax=Amycolatopsis regifaucium TaxID=546365 RepID=A0A154MH56_9PSEU|nr:hypothetical protein [Amycolatopsis regifaucium]KZB83824.1 hypothetical protein AVL48_35130 [Amycolatopsis regifaucium]OKA06734.1 hypothetical protein ATP06_0219485 [Amycolatopsis regifaucium]SFH25490.1 hypothetical protein SAMN04489731_103184 [Amycolatopsis regifaucium]
MAPPRTPKLLIAACSLLLATACGVPAPEKGAAALGADAPAQGPAATRAERDLAFGAPHRFATGVTISVSAPKSFRPSTSAYPQSPRAVAFGIDVTNAGDGVYRLSGLSVTGEVDGESSSVKQVVDAVQGYNGIADAGKDVAPGRSVHLNLAFAVPDKPVRLRLQVRPNPAEPVAATYCGKV